MQLLEELIVLKLKVSLKGEGNLKTLDKNN